MTLPREIALARETPAFPRFISRGEPEPLEFVGENEVRWHNRRLAYFSGCDYFRLARDPRLVAAAKNSLAKHGLNVAASRRTTGNHKIYAQLETALARFFGAETALVLPEGYLAPMAVAQALAGECTHALLDELAHGALVDAARMLDCPVKKFKHRDSADLARALSTCGRNARPMVLTDGMFSHDGSVAPLRGHLNVLPARGRILVDDAHGAGVLGATGKGSLEHELNSEFQIPNSEFRIRNFPIIQCATLSKAFGAYGGAVLAARGLRGKILARSRSFIGTTPLPPPLAGAALAALKILREEPARREKLFQNLSHVRTKLRAAGWDIPETPGPIVRLPALKETQAADLKTRLLAAGIYPPFLKYGGAWSVEYPPTRSRQRAPAVIPRAEARGIFRFVISSGHDRDQLDQLIAVLAAFKARHR